MFEDLGLKYVGPVDGHDIEVMESALRRARSFGGPVIVHAVTTKGFGYPPAETDQIDAWHATGVFDPDSGASTVAGPRLDDGLLRRAGADRRRAVRRRRDHRGDAAPDRPGRLRRAVPRADLRRRHRRAARAHLGRRPGDGRAAPRRRRLLDVPQPGLRPAADGRRPAPPAGDRRPRPGRGHRHGRRLAQRHVGHVDPLRRARRAAGRAARRGDAARGAARGGRRHRRPDGRPLPEGRRRRSTSRRSSAAARSTCCAAASRPDVLLVAVGSMVPMCLAVAERAADHGIEVTVVDPRWVLPVVRRAGRRWPPGTGWSSPSRTAAGPAASGRR